MLVLGVWQSELLKRNVGGRLLYPIFMLASWVLSQDVVLVLLILGCVSSNEHACN